MQSNSNIVYIVMDSDEIVFASKDEEVAEAYAENENANAQQRVLNDWDNDDPSDEDLSEAMFQVGYDGDYYKVERVNISNLIDDDTVLLSDGTEINVSDILDILEKSDSDLF